MKYPASKHYSHLDLSEPIPEIELRYNQHQRVAYQVFRRWFWWTIITICVLQAVLNLLVANVFLLIGISVVFNFMIMMVLLILIQKAQRHAGTKPQVTDAWGIPIREQMRYLFFFFLLIWITSNAHQFSVQGISAAIFSLATYSLMLSIALMLSGKFARQPGQISCMKCDYPLAGLRIPCPCPECGTTISYLSEATDRPRVRDTRMVLVGVAIAILSVSTIVMRYYRPQALYTAMPRAVLLQLAPTDRGAFNTLIATAMTRDEEDQLIAGMYSSRTGFRSGSSYEQIEWFGAMIGQGRLTQAQLDDLYTEFTTLKIDAPKQARVGEPIRLTLLASYAAVPVQFYYCFHGFRVGETEALLAQGDRIFSRTFIVNGADQSNIDRGYVPISSWIPDAPGSYTIRARIVFAMGTGYSLGSTVTWTDEGMPEFLTQPVWTKVVDLEHTIDVIE